MRDEFIDIKRISKAIMALCASICIFCSSCDESTIVFYPKEEIASVTTAKNIIVTVPPFSHVIVGEKVDTLAAGCPFAWHDDDCIGIFSDDGSQTTLSMNSAVGESSTMLTYEGKKLKLSTSYSACFPPAEEASTGSDKCVPYPVEQVQQGNGSSDHVSRYDRLTAPAHATNRSGTVTLGFRHQMAVMHLRLTMPKAGTFKKIIVLTGDEMPSESLLNPADGTLTATESVPYYALQLQDVTIGEGETIDAFVVISPADMTGKTTTVIVLDENAKAYSTTWAGQSYDAGVIYHYSRTLVPNAECAGFCSVPLLSIVTAGRELPACESINAPEGSMGISITNATKVSGRLKLLSADGRLLYDSGEYIRDESGITLKVRGNSSATNPNKYPYKIKLQKNADLLLRDSTASHADKNWALLHAKVKTLIGYRMNELVGLDYAPQARLVHVLLNGRPWGTYLLSETVERNASCRLNVDKKTGYIIERDAYWWNEDVSFTTTKYSDASFRYTFKYPDADDVTAAQIAYIQHAVNDMEEAMLTGGYDRYLDVSSFAAWMLGQDILGNWDAGGSNMFFTKYDDKSHSKIKMGCLWDFDAIERPAIEGTWATVHTHPQAYFATLFASPNKAFTDAYKAKWQELSPVVEDDIMSMLNAISQSPEAAAWGETLLAADIQTASTWFHNRVIWLNEHIPIL